MGHVAIPFTKKEFLFHRGCSNDVTSILKSTLIAGGSESPERPLNPFGNNPDEREPTDEFSMSRKEHDHNMWKPRQDAIHWINWTRAQEQRLQFWQTRAHAVIVRNLGRQDLTP